MKIETALNKRDEMVRGISGTFSMAKSCHLPMEEINSRINEIHKSHSKAPQWVHTYVDGFSRALWDQLYHENLEFCYVMKTGEIYSVIPASWRYYEKHGFSPKQVYELSVKNGFFYKGTDKAFSVDQTK